MHDSVSVLDPTTGKTIRVFEASEFALAHFHRPAFAVAGDNLVVAILGDDSFELKLWSIKDGTLIATVDDLEDSRIADIELNPTIDQIAVATKNGLHLYDFSSTQIRQIDLSRISTFQYSPDGNRLAAVTGNLVTVFDAATGKVILQLSTTWFTRITCLEYSPDGMHLATGDRAGKVRLWKTDTGDQVGEVKPPGKRNLIRWILPAALLPIVISGVWFLSKQRRRVLQ